MIDFTRESSESSSTMYEECCELTCNPWDLRFTQDLISARFRPPYGNFTVYDGVRQILDGGMSPSDFPRIRVMRHEGQLWCLDNRRLYVFRLSKVPTIKVSVVATRCSLTRSLSAFPPNVLVEMSTAEFFPLVIWAHKVQSTLASFTRMMRIWIPGYHVDSSLLSSKRLGECVL
ncbi:hypothetical protein MPTK1_1g01220 [Marchantia polymorpha subsp. ruderalis]|uniref:Uncharacterized protein n=1 Tax=Marchantia polymorpha subsp. ruderalis TaxID=1480154 RepID=A0AAF6AK91_MARPO|nr:hypothetical protein Mp_1g01230 [Marchantia polymorpha subsp. ruderalis]